MNRNVESRFAELPDVQIERSRFDLSFGHKTSFNVGELIPFACLEVLPGDTFDVTTSAVVRLQTLLTPVMDNIYMDTYWFFVPNRIVWEHWKEFMGENTSSAWLPSTSYRVPRIEPPVNGWNVGTIADYLGIPTGVGPDPVNPQYNPNALPFRGVAMIANEWFRDENLTDPLVIPKGDSTVTGVNTGTDTTDVAKGGLPFKVSKYHDYFTSCLPAPLRRGTDVTIFGVGQSVNGYNPGPTGAGTLHPYSVPVRTGDVRAEVGAGSHPIEGFIQGGTQVVGARNNGSKLLGLPETLPSSGYSYFEPTNLWADLASVNLTINELRLAFQLQKFYERMARSGMRYRELIHGMFGVTSPDQRMMIPEYLGGHRFPLSIHQVANQTQSQTDFLGDLGAMSNTSDVHSDFVKSFTEHGYVFGVCCVRYDHSYPQGLAKMWTRYEMLDFFFPTFSNIGETPVRKAELYYDASTNDDVFGYNEAWADYRFQNNRVSGEMRPSASNSLASWHFADHYLSVPSLSDSWIREDKANVDRTLAVTSAVSNQVFCDFWIQNYATRPMPMFSVPGLIDHH